MSKTARQFFLGLSWKSKILLLVAAVVILWLWLFVLSEFPAALRNMRSRTADTRSENVVKEATDAAASSESNANSAAVNRQINEARAADAQAEREAAARNSNLTVEPTRKARRRYEESRQMVLTPAPAMSDDELCAELERRNIPCR